MKAIILVAGYATRLYPLTINRPKALLEVGGRSVLDYICDEIDTIDDIDEIFVVSNHKFHSHFTEWKNGRISNKNIKVIDDGTTSEEGRLGAIGDIKLVLEQEKVKDDIMVIAGDNLFTYRLLDFYKFFKKTAGDCICAKELDNPEELKRMAVAMLDHNSKVTHLEEKPKEPKSSLAVYASYIYKSETIPLFRKYIDEGNVPDSPGHFPAWLYKIKDVYAFQFEGECYDIGTHESYKEVQEKFRTGLGSR